MLSTAGYVFTDFWCLHMCHEKGSDPKRIQVGPALLLGSGLTPRTSSRPQTIRAVKLVFLYTHIHADTQTYMGVHAHTRRHTHIHTNPRILSSCCQHFNVLIFKFEAPTGCLERLIQPVCLGAILFISLLVTSKNSVFLVGCVRVVECFGFWLQLVNFSESVDPGVS